MRRGGAVGAAGGGEAEGADGVDGCEAGGVPEAVVLGIGAEADGEDGVVFGEDAGGGDLAGEVLGEEGFRREAGGLVARAAPVEDRERRRRRADGSERKHGGERGGDLQEGKLRLKIL